MKTKAQELGVTEFPYIEYDGSGNKIYWEDSNGLWEKYEYGQDGELVYFENSNRIVEDT